MVESIRVAQTPDSWGIEDPHDPRIVGWPGLLDQVMTAGYGGVELGPPGYLPTDSDLLSSALAERGLSLSAGYVMEHWADPGAADANLKRTRSTCGILCAAGAEVVVFIDALGERAREAAQPDATRLGENGRRVFADAIKQAAKLAKEDFGLTAVFHPHAGTYVEFEDEIDWLMGHIEPDLLGLCVDTGHSLFCGVDPVELCDQYADRLRYLHFKDVDPARLHAVLDRRGDWDTAVAEGVFCRLGEGGVDFEGVVSALQAAGYRGWIAVEQDRLPKRPEDRGPFDDALAAARYLAGLGFSIREPNVDPV